MALPRLGCAGRLNANMPYDQFLTCQLAGGPARSSDSRSSLGNRLSTGWHRLTAEGGSIAEEWMAENASDRIHTFGTAILGLTVECCRCHDHKYDPISMRDYYSPLRFLQLDRRERNVRQRREGSVAFASAAD